MVTKASDAADARGKGRGVARRKRSEGGGTRRLLLAEEVANAIVERAARAFFQPGQRLIETEVAAALGVSRLPLREALKSLESQGVVISTPHRGTRLMEVNETRLKNVLEVRVQLEMLALVTALPAFRARPTLLKRLDAVISEMERACNKDDRFGAAVCDVKFHRALCVASGNDVLVTMYDALQRQLTILFGLPWLGYPNLANYLADHRELRQMLATGTLAAARKLLLRHIMVGWRSPKP